MLGPRETLTSYDVKSLFTCIPPQGALAAVRKRLERDDSLNSCTKLSVDNICNLLELCLSALTLCIDAFYKQKHGGTIRSPVSQVLADLYVEDFEAQIFASYAGTVPRFRYVDDTFVVIEEAERTAFFTHLNASDPYLQFTKDPLWKDGTIPFLDTLVRMEENRSLSVKVYRKPTHTDQYLFDSSHPLEHKTSVVRTLHHRAEMVVTGVQKREEERDHISDTLAKCGHPQWALISAGPTVKPLDPEPRKEEDRAKGFVTIPYVKGESEKIR